jgi:hypothetical protein
MEAQSPRILREDALLCGPLCPRASVVFVASGSSHKMELDMCAGPPPPRPSLRSAVANFRGSDLGLGERFRLVGVNLLSRVRRRRDCCGHYGEPGC